MKFKSSFELRDVCGEKVLIASGIENIDFSALIHLNSTAADIYNHFIGTDFTLDDVLTYITSEYDVDASAARADIENLFKSLGKAGVTE